MEKLSIQPNINPVVPSQQVRPVITIPQRRAIAGVYSKKHGIDVALICAVVEQESSWNAAAHRYEAEFFIHYVMKLIDDLHLSDTEARDRAYSWGPMQLMGQTARELGFNGDLPALCDLDLGIDWGCVKLGRCIVAHPGDRIAQLLMYNGGDKPEYAAQVMARLATYS